MKASPVRLRLLRMNIPIISRAQHTLQNASFRIFSWHPLTVFLIDSVTEWPRLGTHNTVSLWNCKLSAMFSHTKIHELPTAIRVSPIYIQHQSYFRSATQNLTDCTSQCSTSLLHRGVIPHSLYILIQLHLTSQQHLLVTSGEKVKVTTYFR
jgi:hypothetical protein